jgi:cell division protein FtsW
MTMAITNARRAVARGAGGATRLTATARTAVPGRAPAISRPPAAGGLAAPVDARERHAPDAIMLGIVVALTGLGILMVYSSSAMNGYAAGDGTLAIVGPQFVWAAIGMGCMLVAMRTDYRWLRLLSLPALIGAAILLGLVLFSPWRVEVSGSTQWLRIPGLPIIQPGEFAKVALVVYLAHWMARRGVGIRSIRGGLIPFVVIVAPFLVMIFKSPDLGSTAVLGLTVMVMLFVAGGSLLGIVALGGGAALAASMLLKDYQIERLQSFQDPFQFALTTGFHSVQGLLALGLGGLFGAGLGDRAAAGGIVLPNAHNDYIFAVVGQEFGFVGAALVVIAFVLLAWRGMRISLAAPDGFGALLAAGLTAYLCVQAFINIGVVVTLLPVTGITLPFVSAGGSSLIVSLVAVGILLAISRETATHGGWMDASGDRGRRNGRAHLPGPGRRPFAPRPADRA